MSGITRRDFLVGASGVVLLSCSDAKINLPNGQLLGPDAAIGHKIRDGQFPAPIQEKHLPILIVGAGIAGLSCGWWLARNGVKDFSILELESVAGGNARSGCNEVSAFPWGAHYLPLPGVDAEYVRILLAELNVLKGNANTLAPEYDEKMLAQAPDERLFIHGAWQEGLIPRAGIGTSAQHEIDRFELLMNEWSQRKGSDGRYVFTIPSALGSADGEFLALDKITFHEWMQQQHFSSEPLQWYVSYSFRDDFGADQFQISAWAGLHYFCCRRGLAANADAHSVITSPQGNGWIVERLTQQLESQLLTGQAVVRVETQENKVSVDVYNSVEKNVVRIHCDQLVWAAPTFLLPRIWANAPKIEAPDYAAWLVANLTIRSVNENEFTHWDNVIYQGQGLGYVDATHQQLQYRRPDRVLTYYRALNNSNTLAARRQLLERSHAAWETEIFDDLKFAHPQLAAQCSAIDIWRWPHAMAIPSPGFLQAAATRRRPTHPRIQLAHSDLTGFSLFEEAQYWGVQAAKGIISASGS